MTTAEQIEAGRLDSWIHFIRAHSMIMRQLSAELVREHGLTINDYEVLLYLANAPERRMRRVDLATSVLVTASGITRILQGLQREGFVDSAVCETDRRVSYACLTDAGLERFRAARATHLEGVDRLFLDRLDAGERELLARVFCRLSDGGPSADG